MVFVSSPKLSWINSILKTSILCDGTESQESEGGGKRGEEEKINMKIEKNKKAEE